MKILYHEHCQSQNMTYQQTQPPSQPPTGVKVLIFSLCPEKQENIGSDKVTDKVWRQGGIQTLDEEQSTRIVGGCGCCWMLMQTKYK